MTRGGYRQTPRFLAAVDRVAGKSAASTTVRACIPACERSLENLMKRGIRDHAEIRDSAHRGL